MESSLIRKATAVWRGSGSSADGDLSSGAGVLAHPPYSIRIRFESQPETNTEELIAAACAGCFAMVLTLQLQAPRHTAAGPDTEAVVTLEQGPGVANLTARYLVVDVRASQSIDSIPNPLPHTDPLIRQFERWARGRLAEGFSLDEAAQALATSKRTLARRMQSVLGKSPLAFFQDLRIERAVNLLRTSDASVDQIAAQVGYAEGATLRALLRRRLGRGVREIRRSL
jgi:AraC-like DNA-binding protein